MQVFVTPQAERNFDSIVDDINDKWGERTTRQFIKKADEIFKLLNNYPSMGQIEKDDIRGFSYHLRQGYSTKYGTKRLLFWHFLTLDKTQRKNSISTYATPQ